MASNKWLRDFESGVSKKPNLKNKSKTINHNIDIQDPKPTSNRSLTWGEYYQPVEKRFNSSIESISGHRPRCKRQVATQSKPESLNMDMDESNKSPTRKKTSVHREDSISTRELIFNIGGLGRTRSNSILLKSIGEPIATESILDIPPVRSEKHRLAPFIARTTEAPIGPIQLEHQPVKKIVNYIRAAKVLSSNYRNERVEHLAKPRVINEKVVTDGKDKTMWEVIELKASREPGPGDYNSEASLKSIEAPSGGRFNMSKPKSDIEWTIKRSSEIPDPGTYNHGDQKISGGRFNMSAPLSDIELKILRAKETPGAGEYVFSQENNRGGGRFNESQSKSDIEWSIHRAKQIPGPGEYKVQEPTQKGGRFNESRPQSDVDIMMKRAASLPGPGEYKSPDSRLSGGKFNTSNPKSDLEQRIFNAKQTPGPSDYSIKDDIVRSGGHTGKFPFVYRPENLKLNKFAKAVNTIKTINCLKANSLRTLIVPHPSDH